MTMNIVQRLRRMAREMPEVDCTGCGFEYKCGTYGCAVMREAAEKLDTHEQMKALWMEDQLYTNKLKNRLAEEREKHRWIPVTWHETTADDGICAKRYPIHLDCCMPDDGEEILVTDGCYVWSDICFYDDGYYLESANGWLSIKAWMPMPEPYDPEGAEQEGRT